MGLENLKRINKRRSSNYDTIKIHKLKRISPLKTERKRVNNTTAKIARRANAIPNKML